MDPEIRKAVGLGAAVTAEEDEEDEEAATDDDDPEAEDEDSATSAETSASSPMISGSVIAHPLNKIKMMAARTHGLA